MAGGGSVVSESSMARARTLGIATTVAGVRGMSIASTMARASRLENATTLAGVTAMENVRNLARVRSDVERNLIGGRRFFGRRMEPGPRESRG